jgi:hypothetical protein
MSRIKEIRKSLLKITDRDGTGRYGLIDIDTIIEAIAQCLEQPVERMIDVEKLKQGILAIFALCKKPNYYQILKLIDTLAHPCKLDQISSKDYGADGVGLTHAEVDALGETVKTDGKSAIIEFKKIFDDFSPPTCDLANRILDAIESAGVEFAPEELSEIEKAKKKYEDAVNEQHDNDGTDHYPAIVSYADHFHKVLQARIADLESQVNIIADENQSLEKRIEEKDAEIAGLKSRECNYGHMHPCDCIQHLIPESSELVKARDEYEEWNNLGVQQTESILRKGFLRLVAYKDTLESENARLRGAGKPVVDGSNTEID